MTNPVSKNTSPTEKTNHLDEAYPDYSDFNFEEDSMAGLDQGDFMDVSQMEPELDLTGIRRRIQMLENSIRQNSSLSKEEKNKMIGNLGALEGRVNHAVALEPNQKEALLASVSKSLGEVEAQSLQDPALTNPARAQEPGEEDENSVSGLQDQAKKIKTKLNKMLADGKIAQRVYDSLHEKLSRVTKALQEGDKTEEGQLETIAESLNGINENIKLMDSHYLINGEQITEIPGEDGDKIKKEELPATMQKLMDAVPGMTVEKFVNKLQSNFPDLDANGDGKLTLKEIQDGANSKTFPPAQPNNNLIKFLADLDPDFKDKWETTKRDYESYQIQSYVSSMYKATERAVTLLNTLYPNKYKMYWGPEELVPHKFGPRYYELSDDIIFVDENGKNKVLNLFDHSTKERNINVFFEDDFLNGKPEKLE